jgi:hypothetical protein
MLKVAVLRAAMRVRLHWATTVRLYQPDRSEVSLSSVGWSHITARDETRCGIERAYAQHDTGCGVQRYLFAIVRHLCC